MPSGQILRAYFCGSKTKQDLSSFAALGPFMHSIREVDPEDADFLFVSHRPSSIREAFRLRDRGQVRILVATEALSPDLNIFDYAISYDISVDSDRLFRPHTWLRFESAFNFADFRSRRSNPLQERELFCDFIYSNRDAHPFRGRVFSLLSANFVGVKSYGRVRNNAHISDLGINSAEFGKDWRREKIEIHRRHNFSLAVENARFPGYTSEKLITAFLGGTIPIYWGNTGVSREFNARAFVDVNNLSPEEIVETVEFVKQDSVARWSMLQEPVFTVEQESAIEDNRARFTDWFGRFFAEKPQQLRIRPSGSFPDWYLDVQRRAYDRERFSQHRYRSFLGSLFNPPRG